MKRRQVCVEAIADWENIARAAHRAARAKRERPDVRAFFDRYETSLARVREALLVARLPHGGYHAFEIHDPKRRVIHAAPFPDRVAHHALMAPLTKPLDDWQVPGSFACRRNKGNHAAVVYAQRQCRRFDWYLKMDVRGYFDRIDQGRLLGLLHRRLRGQGLFDLIGAVLETYRTRPGKGLPIGALTSQHFANLYLTPADRWLIADPRVRAHCRYMDDTVVWCESRAEARRLYVAYADWLREHWALDLKPAIIQQSRLGLSFCGYRVHPHRLRPGRRRLRRFAERLVTWQEAFQCGEIDARSLQQNTDALLAMLQPGRSWCWRRQFLQRIAVPEV